MTLQWRKQLSIGNDLIDDDHKYLIAIINQAEHSWKAKNRVGLTAVLDSLSQYSKAHFLKEESIAIAVDYPDASRLHESHEELIKRLDQVTQEIGEAWTSSWGENFTEFLRDWLINHVIKEDMQLKPYLTKHSPKFDPRHFIHSTPIPPQLLPKQPGDT